ncbi:MAG: 30S ribosome-binding factor RbfA [Lachnospiraceae bacterium]|nr:30S ribosome-binding factor RbfA [Lachnospiraceae bacterium]
MKKPNYKMSRRNVEVQRALAEIIHGDIKDPRVDPLTSVTAVEVSPDLKNCKAWISVLGDEKVKADTLAGLKSAVGFIKSQLAHTLNMRNTPDINFVLDQSIEYGAKMSKLIEETRKTDEDTGIS